MWRIATLLTTAALGVTALAGCGDDGGGSTGTTATSPPTAVPSAAPRTLDGTDWVSDPGTTRAIVPGAEITLGFEKGRLAANAGCNGITGGYRIVDGTLRLTGDLARTQMACDKTLQAQEEWLVGLLSAEPTVSVAGRFLTLSHAGERLVMRPGTGAHRLPTIAGNDWTLREAGSRSAQAAPVPPGVDPPTLTITKGGQATVFTGCNRGTGEAEVREDGFVDFGPLALTRKKCRGIPRQLERVMLKVLDGEAAAAFQERDLVLTKDGTFLVFAKR